MRLGLTFQAKEKDILDLNIQNRLDFLDYLN
jgi:hypothetical protein